MLTRCDQVTATSRDRLRQAIARHAPQAPLVETRHRATDLANCEQETAGLEQLRRQPIAAFCGIGNPEAFRATLLGFEAEISDFRVFPDHHAYTRADVEELRLWAGRQTRACLIVTTQKDLLKLRLQQLGGRPLWAVRIYLQVEQGKAELERKVLEVVPVH